MAAVSFYVLGSLESGMSIVSGLTAFALWGLSAVFAVLGLIATARAVVRRRVCVAMALANCTLFICAATLVALKLSRFVR
jgi:hypothetical protein